MLIAMFQSFKCDVVLATLLGLASLTTSSSLDGVSFVLVNSGIIVLLLGLDQLVEIDLVPAGGEHEGA